MVKSFKTQKYAQDYYDAITSSEKTFDAFPDQLDFYIISDVNFNIVIAHHEIESYFQFFKTKYLKQ